MSNRIERPEYLERLLSLKDTPSVKVLSGPRKSGKWTLLDMFGEALVERGVEPTSIVKVDCGELDPFKPNAKQLLSHLTDLLGNEHRVYLFLREIYLVEGWEEALYELVSHYDLDIYATTSFGRSPASNGNMEFEEIRVLPFSFKELYPFLLSTYGNKESAWEAYLRRGGLPSLYDPVHVVEDRQVRECWDNYYCSSVMKGLRHHDLMGTRFLDDVFAYLLKNLGKNVSVNNVVEFLASRNKGKAPRHPKVQEMVDFLVDAHVFEKVERLDLQTGGTLKTLPKYYLTNPLLLMIGEESWPDYRGRYLENFVYLELKRRYENVFLGKSGRKEIDFVTKDDEGIHYFQFVSSLDDDEVSKIKLQSLKSLGDGGSKTIIVDKATSLNFVENASVLEANLYCLTH